MNNISKRAAITFCKEESLLYYKGGWGKCKSSPPGLNIWIGWLGVDGINAPCRVQHFIAPLRPPDRGTCEWVGFLTAAAIGLALAYYRGGRAYCGDFLC